MIRTISTDMTPAQLQALALEMATICAEKLEICNPPLPPSEAPMSLSALPCNTCVGQPYSANITCSNALPDAIWTITAGTAGRYHNGASGPVATFSGTPTTGEIAFLA
jgi:hypothetical protein